MTEPTYKSLLIKEIIEEALGDLADWKKPTSEKSLGPHFEVPPIPWQYLALYKL